MKRADDPILVAGGLQQAQRGRTHGDNTSPCLPQAVQRSRGLSSDASLLRVHAMRSGIGDLDRKECPGADVQRYLVQNDSPRDQARRERIGEVQSRGGCLDRARRLSEYRLVVSPIALVGRAPDVGRQRHGAALIDRLVQNGPMKCKRERDFSVFAFSFDGGIELAEEADLALVPEAHHVAGRQPLGGFYEGAPARAIEALVQRRLDGGLHCAAADATPAQASRNDLSIVDHKRVTGAQQVGQIAHAAVIELRRRAWTHD